MEYSRDVINRLKRVEGQVKGILRMMDEQKECVDVIYQLSAIRNAIDRVTVHVIGSDMSKCLVEDFHKDEELRDTDKIINDAIKLILKTR